MATLRRTYVQNGALVVEEIDDPDLITIKKKDRLQNGDFLFVFQSAVLKIVTSEKLGKNGYRILLYLMAKTEFEKEIPGTLYRIAKELGMQQSAASKAMKELENISIVVRDKSKKTFRLNYEIGFKGSPKNYKKLAHVDKPILLEKPNNQNELFANFESINHDM